VQFHRDVQRFCRIFLAIQTKTTPDKIEPLRVEVDKQSKVATPIYYEFKHTKFPKGTVVDRNGFENPEWGEIDFEDTFFGEGTNKWMLKASTGERGAAIEFFSNLDELDLFLNLFLTGFNYCYLMYSTYGPEHSCSPSLIPGVKSEDKTRVMTFPTFVIQKYMEKPQLIEGCKHTLRLYGLYTQEEKGYVYEEWYTGLSGLKFDLKSTNYICHLTNMDFSQNIPEDKESASFHCKSKKDTLKQVKISEEQNIEIVKFIFESMVRDGTSLLNPIGMAGVFELLGFDILYDANDKAWLIEINDCPDLYGRGDDYYDPFAQRMLEDEFKLTIDKIFPIPTNGFRRGKNFSFLDYPDDKNLWIQVCDNSTKLKSQ